MSERLDSYLVKKGLASSRARSKEMIRAGQVKVDGKIIKKAAYRIEGDEAGHVLEITGDRLAYVSRGGLKLERALSRFEIDLKDKVCMDAGASTGGFTDCMLQAGAAKVFAIDSGSGQLAEKLLNDPRVISLENTNMRYVTPDLLGEKVSFASADVSFISLTKVLLPIYECLREEGEAVCLIKPQFEAGKKNIGKRGVVKDRKVQIEVISRVIDHACSIGFIVKDLDHSPIKGPEGNIEFLLYLKKCAGTAFCDQTRIRDIVFSAHSSLNQLN